MKELEQYLGATYIDICQPAIITETPYTFPNPEMPTIIPDTGVERPKADAEMIYLWNYNIGGDIHHKLRKKCVYENDMHKIYNLVVGQTN